MNQLNQILRQLDRNLPIGYSLIRIFLGIALLVRGYILFSDPGAIIELIGEQKLHMWFSYITIGHLLGGLLIALGLFTRLGALFQIPILFSAVFVVHAKEGLMMGGQSLELASLVLFLLVIFILFGSGPLSLNEYFSRNKSELVVEKEH